MAPADPPVTPHASRYDLDSVSMRPVRLPGTPQQIRAAAVALASGATNREDLRRPLSILGLTGLVPRRRSPGAAEPAAEERGQRAVDGGSGSAAGPQTSTGAST
jgi:hypothetical protein